MVARFLGIPIIVLALGLSLVACTDAEVPTALPPDIEGPWQNVDPDTRSVVHLNVVRNESRLVFREYGSCSPWECVIDPWSIEDADWSLDSGGRPTTSTVVDIGFAVDDVTLRVDGSDSLVLEVTTDYEDDRSTQTQTMHFVPADRTAWDAGIAGAFEGVTYDSLEADYELLPVTASFDTSASHVDGTLTSATGFLADCWGPSAVFGGVQTDYLIEGSLTGEYGESDVQIHLVDGLIVEADMDSYDGFCSGLSRTFPVTRLW